MRELRASWALAPVTPYEIYLKALYELVHDRLDGAERAEFLWRGDITAVLTEFQERAVRQAVRMIRRYNGCFIADVVGLGKSYIGAAVVKHFERVERARPLIICPATLVGMWEHYNEAYQLNARVLSTGLLREGEDNDVEWMQRDERFRHRDFVLVDESHNFRNTTSQRYRVLQSFLATGDRRCVFLTATPRNKSVWDIYHQIQLFHPTDVTDLPVDPPNLREFFKRVEQGERRLPELLSHLLIRRTRMHVLRWYGYDAETDRRVDPDDFAPYREGVRRAYVRVGGKRQFFPQRRLRTVEYSIEATYGGLYERLRARFPDVIFENCAGGGGRTDIGMVRRFSHTWVTDWQIAPRSFTITNGMTMALPPEYVDRLLGGQSGHTTAEFDFQSRLLLFVRPTVGFLYPLGAQPNPLMIARLQRWSALYKDFVRPFMATGRIYHHTPEVSGFDPQGWGVLELASRDGTRAICGLFQLSAPVEPEYLLRMRGLDPTRRYRVTWENAAAHYAAGAAAHYAAGAAAHYAAGAAADHAAGAAADHAAGAAAEIDGYVLMKQGLTVRLEGALTSELLIFEAI